MSGGHAREIGAEQKREINTCDRDIGHSWIAGEDIEICIYCGEKQEL